MVSEAGGAGKLLLQEIALPYSSLPNLRPDLPAPPEGRDANRVEKEENIFFLPFQSPCFQREMCKDKLARKHQICQYLGTF